MGNTTTTTNSSQQATATPEETALNKNMLDFSNFAMPYQKQNYAALSGNVNSILTGQTPMAQGVGGITPEQNQSMVNMSLRSLYPQFQSAGIMDSGSAMQAATLAAQQTSNANAQFNTSAAQNLFNIAVGGQSGLQAQASQNNQILGNQLAGLRSYSGTSSTSKNPFLESFYSSMGSGLGSTIGKMPGAAMSAIPGAGQFGAAMA